MAVADLDALGALCLHHGVPAAVDNTFASPALCVPARHGFAFSLHSTTKYLGGHHDHTGGRDRVRRRRARGCSATR